jgi:hypothetical protein
MRSKVEPTRTPTLNLGLRVSGQPVSASGVGGPGLNDSAKVASIQRDQTAGQTLELEQQARSGEPASSRVEP